MKFHFWYRIISFTLICFVNNILQACPLHTIAQDKIINIVNQNGGWPISDNDCELLNRNRLGLTVDGDAVVLGGKSIGYAVIKLFDVETNIVSAYSSQSIGTHDDASQNKANEYLFNSIREAINTFKFNQTINEIEQYRKKLKTYNHKKK